MRRVIFCLFLLIPLLLAAAAAMATERRVLQARALSRDFTGELKEALLGSLREQGPVKALAVCRRQAPAIAAKFSAPDAVLVRRVSQRRRNPANWPDAWEEQGLARFAERRRQGEALAGMEYYEVVEKDGRRRFRYLKAIPTGAVCLRCHGEVKNRQLRNQLQQLYPEDQAVGYRIGELRGAVSIVLPE